MKMGIHFKFKGLVWIPAFARMTLLIQQVLSKLARAALFLQRTRIVDLFGNTEQCASLIAP
jgi:hypothetical protein